MTENNIQLRNIYATKILKKVNKLTQYLKKLNSIQHGGSESIVGLVNSAMELKEKDTLGKTLDNMELRKEVEKLHQNSTQLKESLATLDAGINRVKPGLKSIIDHLNKNIESQGKMKEMIEGIKRLGELGFDKFVDEINKNAKEFETSESDGNNIVPPLDLSKLPLVQPENSQNVGHQKSILLNNGKQSPRRQLESPPPKLPPSPRNRFGQGQNVFGLTQSNDSMQQTNNVINTPINSLK